MKKSRILAFLTALALTVLAITLIALPASAAIPAASEGQEIDVWLIAGQSNATGYGVDVNNTVADSDERFTEGFPNVYYFGRGDSNEFAEFTNVKLGMGQNKNRSGAEIGIAKAVDGSGRLSAVIKRSYGSTFVYPALNDTTAGRGSWTSPSYIEKHGVNLSGNKVGDLYQLFLKTVSDGIATLKDSGYTPVIKGVLYMQGEAETFNGTHSAAYEELLTDLIYDMRADLGRISGTNLGDMPFVISRLARNPLTAHSSTANLAKVQAAQDAVAANEVLNNVFLLDPATDLTDTSGNQVAPTYIDNTDGWHYDAITQQRIGEAAVAKMLSVEGEKTDYGIIPKSAIDANDYPFAIFTEAKGGYGYEFDSLQSTWKTAVDYVTGLTPAEGTSEAVILLRRDYDVTNQASLTYPQGTGNSKYDITVDLDGHTLITYCTLNVQNKAGARDVVFTIKNGTLLNTRYAILYMRTDDTCTTETTFTANFEDLTIGFAKRDTYDPTSLFSTGSTGNNRKGTVNTNYNVNVKNCVIDLCTENETGVGIAKTSAGASHDLDDFKFYFTDCTVKANNVSQLSFVYALEGDNLYFLKGADGSYGKILVSTASDASGSKLVGLESGKEYTLTATKTTEISGDFTAYNLVPSVNVVNTPYGEITENYLNASSYPFVIFTRASATSGYTFKGGYASYVAAIEAARDFTKVTENTPVEAVILQRRDYEEPSYPNYMSHSRTQITLDLNGYTLNVRTLMNIRNDSSTAPYTKILVKNGTLLNRQYGNFYAQTDSTYNGGTCMEITFLDLYMGFPEVNASNRGWGLVINTQNRKSDLNAEYRVNIVNCTVDLATNAGAATFLGNSSHSSYKGLDDYTLTVSGGKIIANDTSEISFAKADEGDILLMDSSNLPEIILPSTLAEPGITTAFNTNNGGLAAPLIDNGGVLGQQRSYLLTPLTKTEYGILPGIYLDTEAYPYLVFRRDGDAYGFLSAQATIKAALTDAITVTASNAADIADEAIILLRRDIKDTTYVENTSNIATTVTIDLCGYKLETTCITNTKTQNSKNSAGTVVETHGVLNIKNGTLNTKNHGLIYAASANTSATVTKSKSLTVNYENLNIGFEEGADTATLFGWSYSVAPTADGVTVVFNMNFKNCVIDTVTNRSTKSGFCVADFAKVKSDTWIFNVNFEECDFILQSEADIINGATGIKYEASDKIYFAKPADGEYNSLTLPVSAAAPTGEYAISANSVGVFKESSRTTTTVTYKMTLKGTENIAFTPKASVTLDSTLIFNIYLPTYAGLGTVTLNGAPVELGEAKDGYYVISTPLAANAAASELKLVVELTVNGTALKGSFTFSTVKYAQKLLAMDISDEEDTLIKDMLAYINSAYVFFNGASVEAIDAILDGYDSTNVIDVANAKKTVPGLSGATFTLEAKPTVQFFFADGFSYNDFTFKVGERTLTAADVEEQKDGYVKFALFAYEMTEDFSYTVNSQAGEYNLIAYYAYASGNGADDYAGEKKSELTDLAAKFYNYCLSAKEYRDFFIAENNGTAASFEKNQYSDNSTTINYWLYTPNNATENMPLIVYLHGGSGKGDDLELITAVDGFPQYLQNGTLSVDAYVIVPQVSSEYRGWGEMKSSVMSLISFVEEKYSIDTKRISLTGHSMGGTGTWMLALAYSERFSAVAPLSGSVTLSEENIEKLSDLPIWAIVGDEDTVVAPESTINFITELTKVNQNANLTVLEGADHFEVPNLSYLSNEFDLIEWLINQSQ